MVAVSAETTTTARPALTCSICLEVFVDPATCGPCGHSFCWNCLSKWLAQPLSRKRRHPPCPKCTQGIQTYTMSYSLAEITESLHGDLIAIRRRNEDLATPPVFFMDAGGYATPGSDAVVLVLGMAVFILALNAAFMSIQSSLELIVPIDQWPVYGRGVLRLLMVMCMWCLLMVWRGGPAEWLLAADDIRARTRELKERIFAAPIRWLGGLWAIVFAGMFFHMYHALLTELSLIEQPAHEVGQVDPLLASRQTAVIEQWLGTWMAYMPSLFVSIFVHTFAILLAVFAAWPIVVPALGQGL